MYKILERNTRSYIFIFGDHTRDLVNISGKYFSSPRSEVSGIVIFRGFRGFRGNPRKFNVPRPTTPHMPEGRGRRVGDQQPSYEVDHIVGWCREPGLNFPRMGHFPRIFLGILGILGNRNQPARSSKKSRIFPIVFFRGGGHPMP